MESPNVEQRRHLRNRLVNRVSVMGQLSALIAMASTGVTAGVLAHDAQVRDLQAAQAKAAVREQPSPVPAVVRLVPRPIRTVLVQVPPPRNALSRRVIRTSPVRRTVVQAAPRRVVRTATRAAAPRPASKPAATKSSGS